MSMTARELALKIVDDYYPHCTSGIPDCCDRCNWRADIAAEIEAAVAEEREACASHVEDGHGNIGRMLASELRSRGEVKP